MGRFILFVHAQLPFSAAITLCVPRLAFVIAVFINRKIYRWTGNLDEDTAAEITVILKDSAHESGKCVVIVTHSNELAKEADAVFQLTKGGLKLSKL